MESTANRRHTMTRQEYLAILKQEADEADRKFCAFIQHKENSPDEFRRLMLDAEATYGAYAETLYGTQ
jgi:hypothetical protein